MLRERGCLSQRKKNGIDKVPSLAIESLPTDLQLLTNEMLSSGVMWGQSSLARCTTLVHRYIVCLPRTEGLSNLSRSSSNCP